MSKSTFVLLAGLLAGLGSTLWTWQQLRAERDANAALQVRLSEFEHRAEPVASPAPPVASPTPEGDITPRATRIVAGVQPAPAPIAQQGDFMSRQRQLMKIPEYREAMRDAQRQHIESAFRELPRILNLTPERATAVFDLMADQAIHNIDLQAQRTASKEDGRAYARAADEQSRKDDAELQKLLGASNMSRLQEFRDTFGSRVEVNTLRNELGSGPDAMRDDQYESMLGVVYAEQQRMNRELLELYATAPPGAPRSYDSGRTELALAANRRIVESARSILAPEQLATVENLYRRQRLQMETQNTMIRLQAEAATREAREAGRN